MSRRARITLNPDVDTEPAEAPEIDAEQDEDGAGYAGPDPFDAPEGPAGMRATRSRQAPALGRYNTRAIVTAVVAGLAVAALFLVWRNRRP